MIAVSQRRIKHIPERTCIACGKKRPKWELIRIVRTFPGDLEIDMRGKKAGREQRADDKLLKDALNNGAEAGG